VKLKESLISLGSIAVITALGVWAFFSMSGPTEGLCRVCDRSLHHTVTYRMQVSRGSESACCPRCGMHYQIEHPGEVKKAWATDLMTGRLIDAETAVYVEGGDVAYCTMHSSPVQHHPQGLAVRDFDRCLPTLVAFSSYPEAENYQREHGGEIMDYRSAMERVKGQ
jgi:hypothetical protein